MDKNIVIGLLAAVVIIGGGIWIFSSTTPSSTDTASTTPDGITTTTTMTTTSTAAMPAATTGTLVVASNSSAVLTGKVTPNGAQTTYWYEYGPTASLGSKTAVQAIGSGFASIAAPVFIAGLSANASYHYRLVAQNSLGTTSGTVLSFTTNSNPAPLGNAPAVHTDSASNITRTGANLAGHVTANGAETSYWFEYGVSSDFGNTTSFQSAGSSNASLSHSISAGGLQPATKYYFRINAQNQFGTVTGATMTFTTAGPATASAPTADTLAASSIGGTGATLNGHVNPNGAATTYWFEYSQDSLLGTVLGTTTHQSIAGNGTSQITVSAPVSGLARNTTYSYRLVTSNSQGTTRGDIVSFKTTR